MKSTEVNSMENIETTPSVDILKEAIEITDGAKELFTQHLQKELFERFVPRQNSIVTEKLSEMESSEEEDEEEEKMEEMNELQVSEEDPDADQIDEKESIETEAQVPSSIELGEDSHEDDTMEEPMGEPMGEPMEEAPIKFDMEELKQALMSILGIEDEQPDEEMQPTEEPEGEIEIEPGIKQEEVDENAYPTADMDSPKTSEPNSELSAVKKSSSEAEQKPLKEDMVEVSEEITKEEENIQDSVVVAELQKTVDGLKLENKTLKSDNENLRKAVNSYRNVVKEHEMNLTKLDLQTKLFEDYSINESTKRKIMEKFETVTNIEGLKLIYETYKDSLEVAGVGTKKKIVVKETAKHAGNSSVKKIISENTTNDFNRWKNIIDYKYGS